MDLLPRQQTALAGLKILFFVVMLGVVLWIVGASCGCQPKKEEIAVYHNTSDKAASIAADLEARDKGGRSYIVAPTGSMEPTLKGGDYVVGVKTPFEELQVGEIVNYFPEWNPNLLVIHRLVGKWPDGGWIAEGDSPNNTAETKSRVTAQNYVNKIISVYRTP